jgi:gliding motility-associated-like protein
VNFLKPLTFTIEFQKIDFLFCFLAVISNSIFAFGQESANTAGGDIAGAGGSVAFSIGQVVYTTHSEVSGIKAQGVQHRYEIAKVSRAMEVAIIHTPWSKIPSLPNTVNIQTTEGQFVRVGVNWNLSRLNVFKRGLYTLSGSLILPTFITNPSKIESQIRVQVLPKDPMRDVSLTNTTFAVTGDQFFISVGAFLVDDPIDDVHEIRLYGKGYDNGLFEIKGHDLFWSSLDPAPGRVSFTIVVQVTDRDGNTLEKFFELTRIRPSSSSLVIPNTFTPNGDGSNDTWGVPGLRYFEQVRIQIFDRGGVLVFYTENPDERWDGKSKGKAVPIGAYYWVISVKETGEIRRGVLNLLRK